VIRTKDSEFVILILRCALLKTDEIVISSEGDKVAGVEKSIKNRFLRFVSPDLSGLTTVEMTSFQQSNSDDK